MPFGQTFGNASKRGFFAFLGNTVSYWINSFTIGTTNFSTFNSSSAVDAAKNVSMAGQYGDYVSDYRDFWIQQYNATGDLQWQRRLSWGSDVSTPTTTFVDSSNNIYNAFYRNGAAQGFISKYNSSGTLQSVRRVLAPGNNAINPASLAMDSSGNMYISAGVHIDFDFYTGVGLIKLDSAMNFVWCRNLDGNFGAYDYGYKVQLDSSGYIYNIGQTQTSPRRAVVAKYDASGNLQWQRVSTNFALVNGGVDSSGNSYVVGYDTSSPAGTLITKIDSSGTTQWTRRLSAGSNVFGQSAAVSSTGDVYVSARYDLSPSVCILAKYNSSGTLQWQRSVAVSGCAVTQSGVSVDTDGTVYLNTSFQVGSVLYGLGLKIPSDGSLTGTYSVGSYSVSYSASSITEASGTSSFGSGGYTQYTPTITSAAETGYSAPTASATITKKVIP
jgi:hypothetical protein